MPLLLQHIYAARGIYDQQDLEYSLSCLLPFYLFKNIDLAAALIVESIMAKQTIMIIGDFDADGATSTALAVKALQTMGCQSIHFLVPNRFEFGYGLTPELVEVAALKKPDLIITVDNGISSVEGVAYAKQLGIRVLITDHHLPGETLPEADAIINPNLPDCPFPSKHIAGVGVIFYVMLATRAKLKAHQFFGEFNREPNMAQFLDLVALGTVADVVSLDYNNRILVSQGLRRIRTGLSCFGIQALIEVANRISSTMLAADLGFALGPRLNAAGRLEDMSIGIDLLLCSDMSSALCKAKILDQLNTKRRDLEKNMLTEAWHHLESSMHSHHQVLPAGLSFYQANWHQGIIGILAARIKEKTYRPVIVFAASDISKNVLKGSARSIPGFHIRDALATISVQHPNLLLSYGGHAMAAGLSLLEQDFEKFQNVFEKIANRQLSEEQLQSIIWSDGTLSDADLNLKTAELLAHSGPWGQNFPEPIFDGIFHIIDQHLMKDTHLKLRVSSNADASQIFTAICFNVDRKIWPNDAIKKVHLVYQLNINIFHNKKSINLMIKKLSIV
ncbi:MAG: single-stranded-DNA-specific exonuclease RecJ [Endozoicomonadaceae bacterium]|nr:single-stranded-DNA-specific exonuclease RecJ [Endozoicomonadaceae bacterium]